MKEITIYTDGACSYNPGPGGWGAVLIYKGYEKRISGFVPDTTNNRMELQAVISALASLKERCKVNIYTDSAYIFNAFANDWITKWENQGWKTSSKSDVLNRDLWEQLVYYSTLHNIEWHKVKGHADDAYNNICDELARGEILKNVPK